MSRRRIPTPSWERERHGFGENLSGTRGQLVALIAVVVLILGAMAIGGFALFDKYYLTPHQLPGSTALKVGATDFSVREFTNRTKMFSAQLSGTTNAQIIIPAVDQQLQHEAIELQFAGEKNVSATEDQIKAEIAKTIGIQVTDPNFDTRFQEELKNTGLTEQQYRNMATASVLSTSLQQSFQAALPANADSIQYRQIVVADQATADKLKAEIEGGADFAALAAANSTDTATKSTGGDTGWTPRGYLSPTLENLLFSLDKNQVVTSPGRSNVTIYQLVDKDPAHAIEDAKKSKLASNQFQQWLKDKLASVTVDDQMNLQTGNSTKVNYVFGHAALTAK